MRPRDPGQRDDRWGGGERGAGGKEQRAKSKEQRAKSRELETGAVSTSVTLLGQNIGNTLLIIGYTFSVSFAVFFGRISARKKFLVPKSTWPSRRRPNQTSIKSSAIGLSPTDQPPRLALRKSG